MSWIWLILLFLFGVLFGAVITAVFLLEKGSDDDEDIHRS